MVIILDGIMHARIFLKCLKFEDLASMQTKALYKSIKSIINFFCQTKAKIDFYYKIVLHTSSVY